MANDDETTDRDLFVRLLMRHDRAIRAYLRVLLPTANDVDEVMQEVSVVAWRKFGEMDEPDNFRQWICVIPRYEVLMHRRKKARDRLRLGEELELLIADEGVQELAMRERQLKFLEGCLDQLHPDRKQLVLRVYAAEEPMKTIAEQIGRTPEALYKMMSRLRRGLFECVERSVAEAGQS